MGQGHRSRSNSWCPVVDIRGSALPSAVKSKVIVCVSVISGRMWIIVRMRSIGVLIDDSDSGCLVSPITGFSSICIDLRGQLAQMSKTCSYLNRV